MEQEPDHTLAHYLLALSYLAGGQSKLGQKSLIKSLSLQPNFTEAELSLASLYYTERNYDLALEHTKRIIKREPENYRGHLIMGNIHLAQKRYDKAIKEYDTAKLLNPVTISPLYYKAISYFYKGDSDNALQILENVRQEHPKLADATLQYVKISLQSGKTEEAIMAMKDSLTKDSDNALYHHILGEAFRLLGNNAEAAKSFTRVIAADAGIKSAYLKLIEIQSLQGINPKELLQEAITKIVNFREAQIQLSKIYYKNGQLHEAIKILEDALSANPEDPQLANNLAWLYIEHQPDNTNEAMRLAQLSYERMPGNAAVADTLGWIYYNKKCSPEPPGYLNKHEK